MKLCTVHCPACGCETPLIRTVSTVDDFGIAVEPEDAWLRMRGLEDNRTDATEEAA
jgi:hypothetical protein